MSLTLSAAPALAAEGKSFKKSDTIFKLGVRMLFLITFSVLTLHLWKYPGSGLFAFK